MNEEAIFAAALEKGDPAVRAAYLEEACAGDPDLRRRVEALLESHDQAGSFLEHPALGQQAGPGHGGDAGATRSEPAAGDDLSLDFLSAPHRPGALGRLAHYEVLEVVGRGGMGVVLKALDEALQRVVAIKVMAPQLAATVSARKRFTREAQAAAAVRDDHVIDIHAVDEANGLPYLVMECVNGISLQERLDRGGPLELKEVLRIGMQAACGLAAAHKQGLIHRDVKPANILLENGVQRVKLTDFGLARATDDASLTQSGVVAGTPQYMAPEQARGEPVDHRADLFSLGSVLYAMCTGRPPFRAGTTMAVLKRVCEDTPRPVREVNPDVPDWLCAIIDKLHAKDPADRFQSAGEVADLLSQHLAHLQQPALVPPPARVKPPATSPPAAGRRGYRRALAAAVVLVVFGGLGLTEATGVTKFVPSVVRIVTGDGTLVVEANDPDVSVTVDGQDLVITGAGPREVRLRPGTYQVRASKDGVPVPLDPGLVTITRGGKQVVKVSREGATQAQASPPINLRATLRAEGMLKDYRQRVAFSPDGVLLAAAHDDGRVTLWDTITGRVRTTLEGHKLPATALAFAPDGKQLATAAGDWRKPDVKGELTLWDPATGKRLLTLPSSTGPLFSVTFAPDGKTVAAVGYGRTVHFWDAATGKEQAALPTPKGTGYGLAYAPDGKTVAVSLVDTVQLWDVTARQQQGVLEGHLDEVECVAFSPDGKTLATGSRDRTVKLWDAVTCRERVTLRGHPGRVISVVFAPDGKTLASACNRLIVKFWDVASGKVLTDVPAPDVAAGSRLAFSPDGRTLASGQEGIIRLWDVSPGSPDEGWVHLFNGKDLDGWTTHPAQPGDWKVEDGVLVGRGRPSHLFSRREDYEDFHLRVELKINRPGDSGVLFRAQRGISPGKSFPAGYEAQILGTKAGGIMQRSECTKEIEPDRWFTLEVIAVGKKLTVVVNGETTTHLSDEAHRSGCIAVQVWNPGTVVRFRKVEIKELPPGEPAAAKPWVQLFNGKDLGGWKTHPGQPGGWSVQDGLLVGRGRKTHLFSERGDYENFHLRFEAKLNAGGDSGVFFRAPFFLKPNWGGPLGYEAQIAARTGTVLLGEEVHGAPVGLAPDAWFTGEVIATSNRIVVRVNGETTANFADPKRSYAKGHLALQVWQPETVVRFRKIEIRELPPTPPAPVPVVREARRFEGHTGPVRSVAFSPDGRYALSGSGWPEGDQTMRLWDVATGREVRRFLGHGGQVHAVAFSPDGRRALSGSFDGTMRLWDVATRQQLRRFDQTQPLMSVAYSPDGRWALSATDGPNFRCWDVTSDQPMHTFSGHTDRVQYVTFSPDGRRVLSASHDGTMRLWDAKTGQELRRFEGRAPLECVGFSPDGRRAVSSGQDGFVRLWDVDSGEELRRWKEHTWLVCGVAFSPDGRRVVSAGLASVRLWDAETGQELCRFVGHTDMVWSVAFSPDGRHILSGGGGTFKEKKQEPGSDWALRLWTIPETDKGQPAASRRP
jgi:WD40 repeat protein